jgi:GntR family L-lactate dehydrogenase operon transcriptional regulator
MAMRPEFSDRAFKALRIICQASEPMGAGSLARSMTERGDPVSMATAGRILGVLDREGYLEKRSNRGRILSAKGREHLERLEALGKGETLARALLEELKMYSPGDLLDILVTRRAIERETARLAAMRATTEDLEQIKAFAEILDGDRSQVPSISVIDRLFHEAIASAGKNKVLLATLKLVRQDVNTQQIFTFIRQQEGSRLGGDHMPIFLAIAGRDPEDAEKAMLRHIDNIIRDVEHYCGGANPHTDPALR